MRSTCHSYRSRPADGRVIVFQQAIPAILSFDPQGQLLDRWGDCFPGAHGMTLVQEGNEEFLWLTDTKTGDYAGNLYVADYYNHRVQKFNIEQTKN